MRALSAKGETMTKQELYEALLQIEIYAKESAYKQSDKFIEEHQKEYDNGNSKDKQFIIDEYKICEKECKKNIKKIDDAVRFLMQFILE